MKETILQKANDMFLTLGYKSVTMDDIAAGLGISKKTIYQHFANKNELVEESALHLFEQIATGVDKIIADNHNSIDDGIAFFPATKIFPKNLYLPSRKAIWQDAREYDRKFKKGR
jgi:AcrR family transcriptional regulator